MIDGTPIAWRDSDNSPVDCPYCNARHYHGSGDGHRVAHCIKKQSAFGMMEKIKCYIVKTRVARNVELIENALHCTLPAETTSPATETVEIGT